MENKIAIVIGLTLGIILGAIMSNSMIKEHKKCQLVIEENKMLKDMLYEEQNQIK